MRSSSILRPLLIVAASMPLAVVFAETSPVSPQSLESHPSPELSPVRGKIHKEIVKSDAPRALLSNLPARPTRKQLEELHIEGLVLASLPEVTLKDDQGEEKLAAALKAYNSRKTPDDATALESFIAQNPRSPWTPGLRVTYGVRLYHQGRFSEALDAFEKSWNALKDSQVPEVREASVTAAAELASLYARLGRVEDLRTVIKELEGRPISGANTEKIRMAAEGLESMTVMPEHSFKCGPFALRNIRESLGLQPAMHPCIDQKESTAKGVSLSELQQLAGEMDMDWVAAERTPGAKLPLPILAHWKLGHYAAVLKQMDDGRLLVRDPTFLHDFLVTPEVLERESSGRFLVPRSTLGKGWKPLSADEAAQVFGKGAPGANDKDDSKKSHVPTNAREWRPTVLICSKRD